MNNNSFMQQVFLALCLFFPMLLSGCGSSPQSSTSHYNLHFQANPRANNSAPLKVRVLLLKSDAGFMFSDFYSLQKNAQAVLGGNLLNSDAFFLMQGQLSKNLSGQSPPEARYVGIIVEYQVLDGKKWRISLPLPDPGETSSWQVWNLSADELQATLYLDVNGIRNLVQ